MNLSGPGISSAGPSPGPTEKSSSAKLRLLIVALAFLVGAAYVAGVFYMRRQQDRDLAARAAARQREADQQAVEFMGGDRFEILNFYASPNSIRRGDSAELCYGVSNAKTVSLAPEDGPVWPAFSHCLQVSPHRTTTYTLTAISSSGESKTATAKIDVR